MFEEQQDVLAAVAQCRQFQAHHVEPVVEVAAELAALAHGGEVRLGRRDHPAVHRDRLVRAEAFQGVFLQHPQQLDLQVDRHALDLVEEQRAAVGMLDLADPPLVGTGEGVRLVAEYLAVEQVLRQAAAVQRDEGMLVAPAVVVEAARHQLLAGAGLAEDQHVGRGVADVGDQLAQRLDRRRAADDPLRQVLAAGQLATQRADLAGQPALLQGAAGDLDQAFRREGLLHEVVGAGVHRLYRHGDVAVTGDQHHRQARVEGLETLQQGQAVDAGQADVADDDAGEVAVDPLQRLLSAADADAGDVLQLQRLLAAEQDMRIVFDDQDGKRLVHRAGLAVGESGTRDRLSSKAVPPLSGCCTLRLQPAAVARLAERVRPRPRPCSPGLVVKKGSNRWTRAAGGIPGPLSRTRRT